MSIIRSLEDSLAHGPDADRRTGSGPNRDAGPRASASVLLPSCWYVPEPMPLAADVPLPDVSTDQIDLRRTLGLVPPRRRGPDDPGRRHGLRPGVLDARRPGRPWPSTGRAARPLSAHGARARTWARCSAWQMTGAGSTRAGDPRLHPLVTLSAHRNQLVRTGASGDLYGALLPTILEQRITAREAKQQWARLCHELGEPAPGPFPGLLLPPAPRAPGRAAGVVVPPARHRGQAGPRPQRGGADRRPPVGLGASPPSRARRPARPGPGRRSVDDRLGARTGVRRRRRRAGGGLPHPQPRRLQPGRRTARRRCPYALAPRTVPAAFEVGSSGCWAGPGGTPLRTAHDAASFPCIDGDDHASLRHPVGRPRHPMPRRTADPTVVDTSLEPTARAASRRRGPATATATAGRPVT